MTPSERVAAAYRRDDEEAREEIWITRRDREQAMADAADVEARVAAGERLPLAGLTLAVKDNIDVAGMPTTAGCPAFAFTPPVDALAVSRLTAAGAVVIGKTNMDQFATGLVGTRTPYGAVRDARRPDYISGGSSSGSAVAVALGIADIALGTDTAGSGRVPAALQGIVGVKPTRGLVPMRGVLPACVSFDCVSVFAAELSLAQRALSTIVGPATADPTSRRWPAHAPIGLQQPPRVAVPARSALDPLTPQARAAFHATEIKLRSQGAELVEVDLAPFRAAADLLYGGALVAERHAAVGAFIEAHRLDVDPTVGAIITAAGRLSASAFAADQARLRDLRIAAMAQLDGLDALLLPTTTRQPTIAATVADPVNVNNALGTYTNFANLLDLCAVAVPAGEADGGQFGVTVFARAFADAVAADVAAQLALATDSTTCRPAGFELLVVGAHRRGQPLNRQITARGGRFVATRMTAPEYRLYALHTEPAKPGLARVHSGGASIEGELWQLPAPGLAEILAELPQPMTLGTVHLDDGASSIGFLCEPIALGPDATDITSFASWTAYLTATASD